MGYGGGMEIFKPALEDVSTLLPLLQETYHLHHDLDDVYYVRWDKSVEERLESYLRSAVTEGRPSLLAAKEGEECVGLILYRVEDGEAIDTHFNRCGVVIEVVVTGDRRGHGVGKRLLDRVEKEFEEEGVRHVKLHCSSSNQRAHGFYEREGYRPRQQLFCKELQRAK
jgi:ribosomal protein S18 acetylase RimI-like enzyme